MTFASGVLIGATLLSAALAVFAGKPKPAKLAVKGRK
jgi:hypothetical protein